MPLVSAKCTNCGSNLSVENTKDAAICEFCGSAFIVEKAINNYNITNQTSNNISGSVVNIYGGNSEGFVIRAGNLAEYTGASIEVVIPNSVTSIGCDAFNGCIGLTSITIPNSVTSIGDNAFAGCSGLTSITLPDSVTAIEEYAFSGCSGLTSITIPNDVTSISCGAFYDCSGLTSITLPDSVTAIEKRAFIGCSGLTSITIPNSVTSIGDDAFAGCSGLTSITIPNSVTSIGYHAFGDCSGLTSITLPDSVTVIGSVAFSGCSGLTSIAIPDSMTYISKGAFNGCSNLISIVIPKSVKYIGQAAFSGCSGLTSIVIPNSVTSIGKADFSGGGAAFSGCYALTDVDSCLSYEYFNGTPFYTQQKEKQEEAKKRPVIDCYLTTACMERQTVAFDDNCHELTVLRSFRDTYLKNNYPDDIETYYNTAPVIVETINDIAEASAIWAEVYDELVIPSVDYIEAEKLEEAYQHYKDYSLMLAKKYLS